MLNMIKTGSGSNGSMVYSTNEMVIGEWTDGKPLYRKVIQINNFSKGTSVAHGIADIKSAWLDCASRGVRSDGYNTQNYYNSSSDFYTTVVNNTHVYANWGDFTYPSCIFAIIYTKTTD